MIIVLAIAHQHNTLHNLFIYRQWHLQLVERAGNLRKALKNTAVQLLLYKAGGKHEIAVFSAEAVKLLQTAVQAKRSMGIFLSAHKMNQAGKIGIRAHQQNINGTGFL